MQEAPPPSNENKPHGKFNIEEIKKSVEDKKDYKLTEFNYAEKVFQVVVIKVDEKEDPFAAFHLNEDSEEDLDTKEKEYLIILNVRLANSETNLGRINGSATIKNGKLQVDIFEIDFVSFYTGNSGYDNPNVEHISGLMRQTICQLVAQGSGVFDTWYSSKTKAFTPGGRGMYEKILEEATAPDTEENKDSIYRKVNIVFEKESFDGEERFKITPKKKF